MALNDNDDRFPDRRDLKVSLGYMPWNSWPASDPRGGWAAMTLSNYVSGRGVWECPAFAASLLKDTVQCTQATSNLNETVTYWLWRFDRTNADIPLDNFWGKTSAQCTADLAEANNPTAGIPNGASDVEMAVDPYFPRTIPSVPDSIKGRAVHSRGRNRLYLDGHADFVRDARVQ
jgi:prepilin-type processing-associated H-X9-DG protein